MKNTLSKQERDRIFSEISVKSSLLGVEDYEFSNKLIVEEDYGLCCSCKQFSLKRSKYSVRKAYCFVDRKLRLSSDDPITECSDYDKRGSMTLEQMWALATLIDSNQKEKIGFIDGSIN